MLNETLTQTLNRHCVVLLVFVGVIYETKALHAARIGKLLETEI